MLRQPDSKMVRALTKEVSQRMYAHRFGQNWCQSTKNLLSMQFTNLPTCNFCGDICTRRRKMRSKLGKCKICELWDASPLSLFVINFSCRLAYINASSSLRALHQATRATISRAIFYRAIQVCNA